MTAFATSPLAWSAVAGGILAFAYPPFGLGFLAYAGLAVSFWICGFADAQSLPSLRVVAKRAWVFGATFHLATLYWIAWVNFPGMLVMCAILGGYITIVYIIQAGLVRRWGPATIWLFPVLWTGHEYLRGLGVLAFPWTNLSLSQVGYSPLIQFADITGDLGVSFLVAFTNVLVFEAARRLQQSRRQPVLLIVLVLFIHAIAIIYGVRALSTLKSTDSIRVAVLQGDIDSYAKWEDDFVDKSMAVYEAQTRDAVEQGAELVVWPETAAPMYLRSERVYQKALRDLSTELHTSLLIGTLEFKRIEEKSYLRYNAAIGLDQGRYSEDFHAKMHLVPFGEWIPFSNHLKLLDKLEVGGAHFTAGERYVLFDHAKGPYAAAICYESAFPDIIRRFVKDGARFLVNITNDGWYGFSSGPPQHAALAILRAVETRRPIARSANTGISCFIDRAGRMHQVSRQYVPDVRIYDLPLGDAGEKTFFVRHGMWLGQGCAAVLVLAMVGLCMLSLRSRRAGTAAEQRA